MKTKGPAWMLGILVLTLVLSSSATLLDTFQNVKLDSCTCTFSMMLNDDGIVDATSSSCSKKCTKRSIGATLGGPASVSNLYEIRMKVTKGSVSILKLTATLVAPCPQTTQVTGLPEVTQETGPPEAVGVTGPPETNPGTLQPAYPLWGLKVKGPFCDRYVNECLDQSYPNIGQAFRGYNLITGDPLNYGGDPGYKGHIFDEGGQRNGGVRFTNTAGNDLNRCDGSVRAEFMDTADNFLESIYRSEYSSKNFQLGSEIELTFGFNFGLDANANANAGGEANAGVGGGLTVPVEVGGGVEGGVNGGIGGSFGVSLGAKVTLPPLYQSVSSNSAVMRQISEGMESNTISITRSTFSCYEYEFEINEFQHPDLTPQFLNAVKWLESCLLEGSPSQGAPPQNSSIINGTTTAQDECAIKFFENYGTFYIKGARFGSKMSVLSIFDSKTASFADADKVEDCATKSSQWSLLGLIGGGSSTEECMQDLFINGNSSKNTLLREIVVTVGSRPKAEYGDWAEQKGSPEIIHKTLAPISDLFTTDFMTGLSFNENGDATIKELLETYLTYYCGLFRSQCNYVVAHPYCPHLHFTGNCGGAILGEGKCGHYTGYVDLNFLPHGQGTLTLDDEVSTMIWIHGCTADCVVHPRGAIPSGYHLAVHDQVIDHKQWILNTLNKWAVAKYETGYVFGHGYGYGGSIIEEGEEDVVFKHMVVCKTEFVTTTTVSTLPPVKNFTLFKTSKSWVEAVQQCSANGLRLAVISSVEELQQARVVAKPYVVWTAGNDQSVEGQWKWARGSLDDWSAFTNGGGDMGLEFNWVQGNPHLNQGEDCAHLRADGKFEDYPCTSNKYVLCDDGTY